MSHKSPLRELFDGSIHTVDRREYGYRNSERMQSALHRMSYTVKYPLSTSYSGDLVTFGPRGSLAKHPVPTTPVERITVDQRTARMRYFADLGSHNVDIRGKTAAEIKSLRVLFYGECKKKGYAGHSQVSGDSLLPSSVIRPAVLKQRCAKIRSERVDAEGDPVAVSATVSEVDRVFSRWIKTTPGSDEALLWSGKLLKAVRAKVVI